MFDVVLQFVLTQFDEAQEWVSELDDDPFLVDDDPAHGTVNWAPAS